MRISGLLGAVIALSVLTPIAPARADVISPGDLMYTDLYRWQGQYGTLTWREILANFDCTEELTFYLTNVPTPPPPIVIPPTPVIDPVVAASAANSPGGAVAPRDPIGLPDGGAGSATAAPVDPIGTPGGDAPGVATAVPEPSTWAMLLLGFAGLGYAAVRRNKVPISAFDRALGQLVSTQVNDSRRIHEVLACTLSVRDAAVASRGREDASWIPDRATSGRDIVEDNSIGADRDVVANDSAAKHCCACANSNIVAKTGIITMVFIRKTAVFETDGRVLQYCEISPCPDSPNHHAGWVRQMQSWTYFCLRTDLAAIPQIIPSTCQLC